MQAVDLQLYGKELSAQVFFSKSYKVLPNTILKNKFAQLVQTINVKWKTYYFFVFACFKA